MCFFFKYLEAIKAVHPVVVAAPAVANAIVATQNGHMVRLLPSNFLLRHAFYPWAVQTIHDDENQILP